MIEHILPKSVAAVDTNLDVDEHHLHPAEAAAVAKATVLRRQEFATGRYCARLALRQLGISPVPIPKGDGRAPVWPPGVVGSITHCHRYRAAAVAHARDVFAVGIDAEPNLPLPKSVGEMVASQSEREWIGASTQEQPTICWDRLLFSAKESIFKAWFPATGRGLDFEDATVTLGAPGEFGFVSNISETVVCPRALRRMYGRWIVQGGLIATAIVIPTDPALS